MIGDQGDSFMKTHRPNKILTGVAGEYFVAAELSRQGYVASLTLRNTRGIDILASDPNATKSVGIQVKATQGPHTSWIVGRFGEEESGGVGQQGFSTQPC